MKTELLSPAGDLSCFYAAINAGADAVYMGLDRFGARNFAGNLSEEEFIEAIDHAHLFGKRVYLTFNILMKDKEIEESDAYLTPLYKAGLDGVIVQDTGLISHIKSKYPDLEVHVSTQGFITGVHGAKLMKELGYGADYKYAHDFPGHFVNQDYLPKELKYTKIWNPQPHTAAEAKLKERQDKRWGNDK